MTGVQTCALPISAEDLAHKTDFKGLFLDIRTIGEFEEKFEELRETISKVTSNTAPNILVQEMIEGKLETFIGANKDGRGAWKKNFRIISKRKNLREILSYSDMMNNGIINTWRGKERRRPMYKERVVVIIDERTMSKYELVSSVFIAMDNILNYSYRY